MENVEQFKQKINSLINKVLSGNVVLLNFLDESEQEVVKEMAIHNKINAYFYGGFINSEYNRCLLSLYTHTKDEFEICVYKINYSKKFDEISHRSILGSLMSLGIKREVIGDVYISKDKDAYFACNNSLKDFIKENYSKVGRSIITLTEIDYEIEEEKDYIEKIDFISSLRIDVLIASGFNLSRSESHEQIVNGNVRINHIQLLNPSYIVKEKDIISLTHYGRLVLKEVKGKSKSSRYIVKILKTRDRSK